MKQTVKITCPKCGKQAEREVVTRINTQEQPELSRQLFKGELQRFICDECGTTRQIHSELLYIDPIHQYIIYAIPNFKKRKQHAQQLLDKVMEEATEDLSHYDLRIVGSLPELVEKAQLFNHGYDDRVVEIVKLLTDGLFAKERPQDHVKARYFYMYKGTPKLMYITETDQLLVNFEQSLLDFSEEKFKKISPKPGKGEFHFINAEWAAHSLS